MAADWEEIRRLAADFQRAQFTDTVQRLSERNCIEIVAKLIEDKQLDVVHTLDGKEYVTPAQISKEIRDELYVHGGRINIVDLQQILNVDLVHVENRASDIARSDKSIQLVLGQLIDENYMDQLAEEVNDKLQEAGQVRIAELCKTYDLPGDFLTEVLSQRLGRVIQGQMDQYNRGVIFTQAFLARHKARICGLFTALTRPTQVNNLIGLYGFHEHLLYLVLEELVNGGRLKGTVVGGRQDKAVYIPDIYSKTQSTWVDSFLAQNKYLEFDALTRLGIPDPIGYIKKRFKSQKLLFLQATCVAQSIIDQVEASVEEAVSSGTWIDVQTMLPSCLSTEDTGILLNQVMRTANVQSSARILCDTIVVSEKFVSGCKALFDQAMQQKAQKEIKNNPVFLITEDDLKQSSLLMDMSAASKKDKREERRKKAAEGSGSMKGGGGGNAREIRIRKTKKKGRRDDDSDEEAGTAPSSMSKSLTKCLLLDRPLTKQYQEVVRAAFLSSSSMSSGASRKQSVKELQEEITNLYNNIRLFEKGAKFFSDETHANIAKHVLRTICTDVTNILLNFVAAEFMTAVDSPRSITNESIEDFLIYLEPCVEVCGFMLKKGDKKRERQALFQHRQALMEQLKMTEDPALVLHLTSVLLFQQIHQCALHVPGRCVPHVISSLVGRISEDQRKLLSQYQTLVVKQLVGQGKNTRAAPGEDEGERGTPGNGGEMEEVRKELLSLTGEVKQLVLSARKTSLTED
uniref:E3 UFM1-protein ligase 1 n=1 Tax=Scleropages formosus TaxID=113540 RepID=A0A8C9W2M6_SCLFO